jgi:hypothetical protein
MLVLAALLAVSASAQYCTNVPSGFSCAIDEYISNVTVGAISNSSTCGPGYEDYSTISTGFVGGGSYPITVTVGQWFSTTDDVTVYVDWNGDIDFSDAGESFPLLEGPGTGGGTVLYTGTIAAPASIVNDPRMRVVLWYGIPQVCPATPAIFGNVEDYGHPPFTNTWFDVGPNTLGFTLANGDSNGTYIHIVTLNAGLYPSGWFFGIDTSFAEIANEVSSGFPFVGPLDAAGGITVGPVGGLPSGLSVYSVAFSTSGGTSVTVNKRTEPTTHTVP